MPRSRAVSATRTPRLAVVEEMPTPPPTPGPARATIDIGHSVAIAIIGLLVSLMGTGIVAMVVLYANVSRLTEAQMRTEQQLARHLDHSVDKDSYDTQTKDFKRALNDKASNKDLDELREQVRLQLIDLKEMIQTVSQAYSLSTPMRRR